VISLGVYKVHCEELFGVCDFTSLGYMPRDNTVCSTHMFDIHAVEA